MKRKVLLADDEEAVLVVVEATLGNDGTVEILVARDGEEVRLLHVHPDFAGRGAGALLLNAAKRAPVAALELWCFQANHGARRFYESHDFRAVRFTDGEGNEERLPDVRYRWDRPETSRPGDP